MLKQLLLSHQSVAAEARWAHNSEVYGLKAYNRVNVFFSFFDLTKRKKKITWEIGLEQKTFRGITTVLPKCPQARDCALFLCILMYELQGVKTLTSLWD